MITYYHHLFIFLDELVSGLVNGVLMLNTFLAVRKTSTNTKNNLPNSYVCDHAQEEFIFLFIARPLPGGMAR
ncbi:MAG: hypothetical protein WCL14_10165 [Bacteroidota bacterium]